ncbi:MAG: Hsp20/alpha crystallin family protein [Acidobacteria bacterium]|nr:Hsp20/alpha crystallin family protein [Acidobacteriota bacterium]
MAPAVSPPVLTFEIVDHMASWKSLSVFYASGLSARAEALWHPLADVHRTRDGWLLKFELAGVRPEDVSVEVQGDRVQVTGLRRDSMFESEQGAVCYSMEISYNRFERIITLPCEVETARFTLEFRDGILLVRIVEQEGCEHG